MERAWEKGQGQGQGRAGCVRYGRRHDGLVWCLGVSRPGWGECPVQLVGIVGREGHLGTLHSVSLVRVPCDRDNSEPHCNTTFSPPYTFACSVPRESVALPRTWADTVGRQPGFSWHLHDVSWLKTCGLSLYCSSMLPNGAIPVAMRAESW